MAPSAYAQYKYGHSISADRDDLGGEFGDTSGSGIGDITVGL